jgi:hypothetical protein
MEIEDGLAYVDEKYVFEPLSDQYLFEDEDTARIFATYFNFQNGTTNVSFGTFQDGDKPVKKVIGYIYVIWHDTNGNGQHDPDEPVYVGHTTKPDRLGSHATGSHGPFIFPPENFDQDHTNDIPVRGTAKPVWKEPGCSLTDHQVLLTNEFATLLPHLTPDRELPTDHGPDNPSDPGFGGFTGLQNDSRPLLPENYDNNLPNTGGSGVGNTVPVLVYPGNFVKPDAPFDPALPPIGGDPDAPPPSTGGQSGGQSGGTTSSGE